LRAVIAAQDTDPGSGERHIDQGLVPDRLALLGPGASRPRQFLQEPDRPAGVRIGECTQHGHDPGRVGALPGRVSPVHPVSPPLHPVTQQADPGPCRADQYGLVLIEPGVNESEHARHQLIAAGVQERGMTGLLPAAQRQVIHRSPPPLADNARDAHYPP
jgi:hypothetical protein